MEPRTVLSGGVHQYTKDKLQEYIQEDDDTLPLKNAYGTVSCGARFMLEPTGGLPSRRIGRGFAIMPTSARVTLCFPLQARGPAPPFSHRPPSLDAMPSAPSIAYEYHPSSIFSLSLRLDVPAL